MKWWEGVKKKITYRFFICICIFFLIALLLILFGGYTYYNYRDECKARSQREAEITSNRLIAQVDETLHNLKQYYLSIVYNDTIKWLLENDLDYSDYSKYKPAYDELGLRYLFNGYITSFTFVNFKTGWILSNKGLFPLCDAYNGEVLTEFFEKSTQGMEKNYWSYSDTIGSEDIVDRKYRITLETSGLNLVFGLPSTGYSTYSMLIANINMNTWKNWIKECLNEYEEAIVIDSDNQLIYATNEVIGRHYLENNDLTTEEHDKGLVEIDKKSYMISSVPSKILSWRYIVLYDVEKGQVGIRFSYIFILLLFLYVASCFLLVSYLIYHPIDNLVKSFSSNAKKNVVGKELEYLKGSYNNLKEDNEALEGVLVQQQDRLQELFELRLIRGEVESDEWGDYLSGFNLKLYNYYATVVVILNLKDEEMHSVVSEDAICLKITQEMPLELKKMAWMQPIYNASTIFAMFAEDDETQLLKIVRDFYSGMQLFVNNTYGFHILMGVSATHTNYHHIRGAYRESVNALTFKMVNQENKENQGTDELNDCHFYLSSTTLPGNTYNSKYETDIQAAIKAVDKKQCYQVTDAFSKYLYDFRGKDEELLLYLLRFVNSILMTAVEAKIDINQIFSKGMRNMYRELLEVVEPDRARRYVKSKFIDPILKARTELMDQRPYTILEEIEKAIEDKRGNITLSECAEAIGVHSTYIWKVLKMERGKSFSDYLEEYKVEEAKNLLLHSTLTVAEIADKLNYTNAQNFIRFFSKNTGVTPGKFRKLY